MFRDNAGNISSSKILSFLGYIVFLGVSIALLFIDPSKFDYTLFAIVAGGGGISARILDKYLNVKSHLESKGKDDKQE